MIHVKNIDVKDAHIFWQVRLEALQSSPEAFSAAYEESVLLSPSDVERSIHNQVDNYMLGAFTAAGLLVGITGFRREQRMKLRHKATVTSVYVTPAYRGKGIAKALLSEIIERGKTLPDLKQINLTVVSTNEAAVKLYEQIGFKTYGFEQNALVVNGQSYDENYMVYTYN